MAKGTAAALKQAIRSVEARINRSAISDRELILRFAQENDQTAFATLVRRYSGMVFSVCRRTLPNVQDAEDACQATFLVLMRKAAAGQWRQSLANWLYTTARKIAANARLAAQRRARREGKAAVPEAVHPADQITGRELLAALYEELDKLSARYRDPLVLCYLEGLSREEVATRLGIPAATVKKQLERGRKKLGDALIRRGCDVGAGLLAVAVVASTAGAAPPRLIETVLASASVSPPAAVTALAKGVIMNALVSKTIPFVLALVTAGMLGIGMAAMKLPADSQPTSTTARAQPADKAADTPPATQAGLPPGWFGGSGNADAYESGIDRKVVKEGKIAAYVRMKDSKDGEFGTLAQSFLARAYRGKRVRLSAQFKTKEVKTGTGLWMRIDGKDKTLGFDNMADRRLSGTGDWKKLQIVLDVSDKANVITIGMLLAGDGHVWVDDFKVEVVGKDVATTAKATDVDSEGAGEVDGIPEKPANLGFETLEAGA